MLEDFHLQDVADLAAKVLGKVGVIGGQDDLTGWVFADEPSGEALRRQLALAVARRHCDDQAEHPTGLDLLKGRRNHFVVLGWLILGGVDVIRRSRVWHGQLRELQHITPSLLQAEHTLGRCYLPADVVGFFRHQRKTARLTTGQLTAPVVSVVTMDICVVVCVLPDVFWKAKTGKAAAPLADAVQQ